MIRHLALISGMIAMACGGDDGATGTDATTTDPTTTEPTATNPTTTDPTVTTTEPTTTEPTTSGPTTSADSTGTSTADSTGTTDGTSSDGTAGSSSDGGVTTGEPAELQAALVDVTFYMNCKPIVPPDPLVASGWIDLDNGGGDVAAVTVTSARLLSGGVEAASFELTPSDLGPVDAGAYESVPWDKTMNSLMPAMGCDTLDCGAEYSFEVVLDVDGAAAIATEDIVVECAF
jgi:hypothetical protein